MIKTAFVKMCMNAQLKAELQQAADEENRKLSNFIETNLYGRSGPFPQVVAEGHSHNDAPEMTVSRWA